LLKGARPVVFSVTAASVDSLLPAIAPFKPAVAVSASDLQGVAALTQQLTRQGIQDILLDTGAKPCAQKLWDLTQIRRLALRKSERSLGFPSIVVVDEQDPAAEALQAATYILKYAGLVLVRSIENWQSYALLTLRQNIYSDPQKPLQIEPKLYEIGTVTGESPVLVTTNFSLSYYTVLGEVEASKIPVYILSVDTEGMSVLTAWAAEKFTPERITQALQKMAVRDKAQKSALVIPGYVAVMSGDLEDQSKWDIIVGPKEASGIPAFLKTLGHGKVNR
jgi:acetyl-CoA decarbonylase/synthase complex subunit gamma